MTIGPGQYWLPDPPPLSPPPPPPGPPRSRIAALLLNLTGLSLGYLYLGRWLRAVLHLAATAGLVALGFANDAAGSPALWRTIALAWLAWQGIDAVRIALRHERPRQPLVPVATAAAALVAVIAAYVLYGAAGRRAYATGLAAQSRADCPAATRSFDAVTGRYELTLSRDVAAAEEQRDVCRVFEAATAAEQRQAYTEAVDRYHRFRADHPDSTLTPFVHDHLKRTYTEWARSLRAAGAYTGAIKLYRDLLAESGPESVAPVRAELADTYLEQADRRRADGVRTTDDVGRIVNNLIVIRREFADTPAARKIPTLVARTFSAANGRFERKDFCAAIPMLDHFITLDRNLLGPIYRTAHNDRAVAMLTCGLREFRAGHYDGAISRFAGFIGAYPRHSAIRQARSALIAAKVAEASNIRVSLPRPFAGDESGPVAVTFYNSVSDPVHILLTGPTAHEVTIPGCTSCPPFYTSEESACPTVLGLPAKTIRLANADYHLLADHESSNVTPVISTFRADSNITHCLYVERPF